MRSGVDVYDLDIGRMCNVVYTTVIDGAGPFADRSKVRASVDQQLRQAAAQFQPDRYAAEGLEGFFKALGVPVPKPEDPDMYVIPSKKAEVSE